MMIDKSLFSGNVLRELLSVFRYNIWHETKPPMVVSKGLQLFNLLGCIVSTRISWDLINQGDLDLCDPMSSPKDLF